MMNNLFSIFDPHSSIMNFSLNWLSIFIGFLLITMNFWMIPSQTQFFFNKIAMILHNEFNLLLNNKFKGMTFLFISMFMFIMFNNFLGLFPHIFTTSSHLVFTLSLSLPIWLTFMLYGWITNTQHMFIHLVPQNTPTVLMSFMVLIESISNLIRPGTLAIRLMANMITGHLLITLMSSASVNLPLYAALLLMATQILLMLLEIMVSLIQSYVFVTLSTLYSSEVN